MKKQVSTIITIAVVLLIAIVLIGSSTFVTVRPGEKAIIFRKWTTGLDKDEIYHTKLHVVAPWNEMIIYDVKEQSIEFEKTSKYGTLDVLDKEGLSINIDVTIRFFPKYDKIGYIHEQFGKNYVEKLIVPEVRSSVRKVMGRYEAEEIFATKRKDVEEAIRKETKKILNANNIEMQALLIRSIILPEKIKNAIENKLEEQQKQKAMEFVLKRKEKEAIGREIEARGKAKANNIVNNSLTEKVLRMKGIEATEKLIQSENAKVIVIGSESSGGLPIILGGNN